MEKVAKFGWETLCGIGGVELVMMRAGKWRGIIAFVRPTSCSDDLFK